MNYIDAHVHVWTDRFTQYPLAEAVGQEEVKPPRFLPQELLAQARPCGVRRIVLIQMSYYGTDNRYLLDVIQQASETFRGIAVVDEQSRGLARQVQKLKEKGVRGFRVVLTDEAAARHFQAGGFDSLFRCAGDEGLAVCPLLNPEYLPLVEEACARFPETRVVIDHLARIGMNGPVEEEQVAALCRLAAFPQIYVKISAFYALGEKRPPHLDLAPLIRRVYESYGARRLMWGSDCPFQILQETYEDSLSLLRDRLDFLSEEDRQQLLRATAEELFWN